MVPSHIFDIKTNASVPAMTCEDGSDRGGITGTAVLHESASSGDCESGRSKLLLSQAPLNTRINASAVVLVVNGSDSETDAKEDSPQLNNAVIVSPPSTARRTTPPGAPSRPKLTCTRTTTTLASISLLIVLDSLPYIIATH